MTTLQISARAVKRAQRKQRNAESGWCWQLCMIVVFVTACYAVVMS
jgi:hypothetical protein